MVKIKNKVIIKLKDTIRYNGTHLVGAAISGLPVEIFVLNYDKNKIYCHTLNRSNIILY